MWKSDENGVSSGYGIGFKLINSCYLGKNVQNWALLLSSLQILYIHLSGNTVVYIGLLQKQKIKVHIFYIFYAIIDNCLYSLQFSLQFHLGFKRQ